jgi:hypothetical protein
MRYSVCTVKVWLYKSRKAPKFRFRVFLTYERIS